MKLETGWGVNNINSYSADLSMTKSGVAYAANRVDHSKSSKCGEQDPTAQRRPTIEWHRVPVVGMTRAARPLPSGSLFFTITARFLNWEPAMKRRRFARRKGNILAMTALLMIAMMAFLAMAVDAGYLYAMRTDLQRSADAAAIAAAWELMDKNGQVGSETPSSLATSAECKAVQFAALNRIGADAPALGNGDVIVGYMANPQNPSDPLLSTPNGTMPNAVQVRVQRTSAKMARCHCSSLA